jgi:iron-sulfur cluster assembly accessory protein
MRPPGRKVQTIGPLEAAARPTYVPDKPEHKQDMTETASLTVTDRAFRRIAEVLASEPQGAALRVAVNGGGCSGFQYVFDIEKTRNADDVALSDGTATVLVDEASLQFLGGSTIDFVDDLIGQSFKITNPNATSSCGCGTSFAV